MTLKLGDDSEIENPSEAQIEAALRALPGGGESFAILAIEEQRYIQTQGGGSDGFVLEYRDGSEDEHYRSADLSLPLDAVLAAFRSYRRGDGAFRTSLAWEKQDAGVTSSWVAQGMLVFFLVVAAFVLWRLFG